ncbi:MAG TPA: class 1 isoprenoid biosynthesis enzyme [Candidatus Polarisedimenticolia bacterium]|jgi:geranylgeranyl pyrophosphate synthase|nr:class 1 isoprenoid biosynthesis enzyme [Candidatus Polarisedimenticolia bacterium]
MLEPLREQIQEVIATRMAAPIRADLLKLLGRPGFALHPDGSCQAGTLALRVHQAVTREPPGRSALLAAAAVELQMNAAYVFDEVADAAGGTRGEDLGLAIALLTAGAATAMEAAADTPGRSAALDHFCRAYSEACAGQSLDAGLQGRGRATLEEALQMTSLKAGGLGKFVTGFVARVAGADGEGVALLERFGYHTFTLAQLVDDLRDACAPGRSSDLAQRKATLPVVFYGQGIDSPVPVDGILSQDICDTYESSGARLYVSILAHAYMSRAEEDLTLLARRGYAVGGLVGFLESVDSGAGEVLSAVRSSLVA